VKKGGGFLWPRKNSPNSSGLRLGGLDRSPTATSISSTPSCGTGSVRLRRLCAWRAGNEDVTYRRLRRLWEHGLVARWAFPGFRTHSEFYYYLDTREPLALLAEAPA
jgi:hypothetical protein